MMEFKEILKEDNPDNLESMGVKSIKVTYKDKSKKIFDLFNWCAFRDGIIRNLYKKGNCKIEFQQ